MNRVAEVDLKGTLKQADIVLGGNALGRPYTSGAFSVGGKNRLAFTLGRDDRPADLALRFERPRVLTDSQRPHGSTRDGPCRAYDLGLVARRSRNRRLDYETTWFRFRENLPNDSRDPWWPHSAYGPN